MIFTLVPSRCILIETNNKKSPIESKLPNSKKESAKVSEEFILFDYNI